MSATGYISSMPREQQDRVGKVRMFPSGNYIDPFDVKPEEIEMRDLAHHLALINRYTGGSPFPAPVATHSVRMARRAIERMRPTTLREWQLVLAHLMHDGSEALGLNDMASPTKRKPGMEAYRAAHERAMVAVFTQFRLPIELLRETQQEDDFDFRREVKSFYEPESLLASELIKEVTWRQAEAEFIDLFNYISARIVALEPAA